MSAIFRITTTTHRFVILLGATVFALFVSPHSFAQELNFRHISVNDGLPQTQVQSLHRDSRGYLWIGTYGGIGRYNRHDILVFDTSKGLSSNTVLAIDSTPDGQIWAGTSTGLCVLPAGGESFSCLDDPALSEHVFYSVKFESDSMLLAGSDHGLFRIDASTRRVIDHLLPDQAVVSIACDENGTIWAGTRNGLFQIEDHTVRKIELPARAGQQVLALLNDHGQLWIGTATGLFHWHDDEIHEPDLPDAWPRNDVTSLTLAADGRLWAASNYGVLRETGDGFELLTTANGLSADITLAILGDVEGNVWLGTDDGLSRFAPGPFVSYHETHGLLHYFVRTLAEDAQGNLWLGTRNGAQRIPKIDGQWRLMQSMTLTREDGLADPRIYSITFDGNGDVLMATGDGLIRWRDSVGIVKRYDTTDGLPTRLVESLAVGSDGRIWMGTEQGIYTLENERINRAPHPLGNAHVVRIREDHFGNLWFGSQDHGLLKLDPQGELTEYGREQGLSDESIWDIAPDDAGGIWVGSNGDGLFHIAADETISRYTTTDGLVNNFIWQVLVDTDGAVWVYTNRGISRFQNGVFENFDDSDGLSHLEGGATGALQTSDGNLWFASADGLMRYIPELEMLPLPAPPVVIEKVELDGESIASDTELPYQPGLLTVHYAALGFRDAKEIRYRYRLGLNDDNWIYLDEHRPLTFANLNPGKYRFEIQARRPNTEWQDSRAAFEFSVATPLWRTVPFMVLLVLLSVGSILYFMSRRTRRERIQRIRLEKLVVERTHDLQLAAEALRQASMTDPLTGLMNRRYLASRISADVSHTRRLYSGTQENPNRDLVFVMIDIDHFKPINDTYGHIVGDQILQGIAKILQSQIRESDYIVRFGGEEFLIVARNTESGLCSVIAERLLTAVRNIELPLDATGTPLKVTISIGLSHFPFTKRTPDSPGWEQILDIADTAVYMAKSLGRDGWVAIHAADAAETLDTDTLLHMIKDAPKHAWEKGVIRIESSFGEVADIPGKP